MAGIVLCGGQSSRMGRAKAWLPFAGETMLARVVRLLSEVVRPIVVVAAPGQDVPPVPADVELVRDEEQGSKGTLLEDTPGFEKRSKVYALGELWVSYANGTDEAPLLHGQVRM